MSSPHIHQIQSKRIFVCVFCCCSHTNGFFCSVSFKSVVFDFFLIVPVLHNILVEATKQMCELKIRYRQILAWFRPQNKPLYTQIVNKIVCKTIQLCILRHRLPLNQPSINVIQAFRMIIRFFLNASNYWLFFSYIFFLL